MQKSLADVLQSKSVNILDFKSNSKSNRLAQALLAEAKKHEPNITKDLRIIASAKDAKMVSLEERFKSPESLSRKLLDTATAFNIPINKIASKNNDTLRYTFVLGTEKYAIGFAEILSELKQKGYEVPKQKIWNAWKQADTDNDKGYRGINITVISSQKQKFELQFHTVESFRLKTKTHGLYEEARSLSVSKQRKSEIKKEQIRLAKKVKRPKGI